MNNTKNKNKKWAGVFLAAAVTLTGFQLGQLPVSHAAASSASPAGSATSVSANSDLIQLPVKETLQTVYHINPERIYFNASNGYLQIDGQNALKPVVKNGVSYASSSDIARAAAKAEQQDPMTFVLIHGSWTDASFWDKTSAELRKFGHTVYAPEYAGHGKLYDPNVTHEQIVTSVVDYIKANNLKNVVLVGHSFGGTVIQKVAEQIPDRIHRLVFFDAFVPLDGQSLSDQLPAEVQAAFGQLAQAAGDNTIPMPYELFRESFVNTASTSLAKEIYSKVKPEPAGPLLQKLDLKTFYSLNIPKSYLYLTSDSVLPQGDSGFNTAQAGHLGQFRLITGEGDHMTTAYAKPGYLESKLYEAARD